jgi:hypothetical protein
LQSQTRPQPENRLSISRLHVIHRQRLTYELPAFSFGKPKDEVDPPPS